MPLSAATFFIAFRAASALDRDKAPMPRLITLPAALAAFKGVPIIGPATAPISGIPYMASPATPRPCSEALP